MSVSVRDARELPADRRWIAGVYRQYLNEISPASTGLFPLLAEYGQYEPELIAQAFADRSAKVLVILNNNQQSGFAVVRRRGRTIRRDEEYTLAEFFIASEWRRHGIGQAAARLIFDRFAGQWHISESTRNTGALRFWKRVLIDYTGGQYREQRDSGELHQYFDSARAGHARR